MLHIVGLNTLFIVLDDARLYSNDTKTNISVNIIDMTE